MDKSETLAVSVTRRRIKTDKLINLYRESKKHEQNELHTKKGVELKFSLRVEHKICFWSSLNLIEGHCFFICFCMLLVNRINTYHIACTTTLYCCLLFVGSRIERNLYFFLLSLQQWSIWEKLWISL